MSGIYDAAAHGERFERRNAVGIGAGRRRRVRKHLSPAADARQQRAMAPAHREFRQIKRDEACERPRLRSVQRIGDAIALQNLRSDLFRINRTEIHASSVARRRPFARDRRRGPVHRGRRRRIRGVRPHVRRRRRTRRVRRTRRRSARDARGDLRVDDVRSRRKTGPNVGVAQPTKKARPNATTRRRNSGFQARKFRTVRPRPISRPRRSESIPRPRRARRCSPNARDR